MLQIVQNNSYLYQGRTMQLLGKRNLNYKVNNHLIKVKGNFIFEFKDKQKPKIFDINFVSIISTS